MGKKKLRGSDALEALFHDVLKEIYYAEGQILKALPKMARDAQAGKLRLLFRRHEDETQEQIRRLRDVFDLIGKRPKGKSGKVIDELLSREEDTINEYKRTEALDDGLIASAQAVGHYEIARYATLKRWALRLGQEDAARLFDEAFTLEAKTDQDLGKLADTVTAMLVTIEDRPASAGVKAETAH